jgi:hypothetical protein
VTEPESAFNAPPDYLRMVLGTEAAPAKEDPMDTTQTSTTETKATTKPKKGKAKRDAKARKAAAKPMKAKKPKEALVVFALRMTEPERTKLHETAGPRGATRMARQVLVAATTEDPVAFKAVLDEARRARG